MRVVAITGGIGSGKTTVAGVYRSLGVPVLDADAVSRQLTGPGGEALPALREAFGDAVFYEDGTLNRAALASRVFGGDAEALSRLNAILHPLITRRLLQALHALAAGGEPVALLDVPLLFETGMDRLADAVICVTAPEALRVRRVVARDRISREDALDRIRNQNPAERTASLSDYVLSTDASLSRTRRDALALWRQVLRDGPKRPLPDTPAQP
ncbi:MAG: dephospho-CoA kinase [Clostridiales bacterium]|nr:dephospho-CoA kinase [Clostridiales bacterium]